MFGLTPTGVSWRRVIKVTDERPATEAELAIVEAGNVGLTSLALLLSHFIQPYFDHNFVLDRSRSGCRHGIFETCHVFTGEYRSRDRVHREV